MLLKLPDYLIFNLCQTVSRDTVDWNSFLGSKLFVVLGFLLFFLGGGGMGEKTFLGSEKIFCAHLITYNFIHYTYRLKKIIL
jgi:Flp pilus assembly protein protease CpaA